MKYLDIFDRKNIRRIWHNDQWYFSVIDIVDGLTDQNDLRKTIKSWNGLIQRLKDEGSLVIRNCHNLKIKTTGGIEYSTYYASLDNIFRIIQSISSKKAETYRSWLAEVGYEKIKHIHNPRLAKKRRVSDLELIFSMLGEKLTTETTRNKDAHGFNENKDAAKEGGKVAGRAREDAEKNLGVKVVSKNNYLDEEEKLE